MKFIKLSDFIKIIPSPFLLGALINRINSEEIDSKKFFYAYTSFRTSKFVDYRRFNLINYADELKHQLNNLSFCDNRIIYKKSNTQLELRFYLLNDANFSELSFYTALYHKILASEWVANNMQDQMNDFIRGFMELRGSVDTTAEMISQDYFYNSSLELKKARILTEILNLPLEYVNFNPRNLQPQYVNNVNRRNAQFRINIFYYANKIGFLNKYKAKVFETVYNAKYSYLKNEITYFVVQIPLKNNDSKFIKYLNFFTNNIYKKQLTPVMVKNLRKQLHFKTGENENIINRNQTIVQLFDYISEDKCAVCGTTKTYEKKGQIGKQYFEIHHVIPFCNGKNVDNIANLVKLCPTCHRMLKKGSGTKSDQIKAIYTILHNHPEVYEFVSSYLGIDDINILAEKIQALLA